MGDATAHTYLALFSEINRSINGGRGGDLLDLVLTVDVGLEHQIPVERDRDRLAVGIEHLGQIVRRPLGSIAGPVLGLDIKTDGAGA